MNTSFSPDTSKVGVIVDDGFNGEELIHVLNELKEKGIQPELISDKLGVKKATDGAEAEIDHTFLTSESVLFDAIYAVGGNQENKGFYQSANYFINEAFSHFKPIGGTHEGMNWLENNDIIGKQVWLLVKTWMHL